MRALARALRHRDFGVSSSFLCNTRPGKIAPLQLCRGVSIPGSKFPNKLTIVDHHYEYVYRWDRAGLDYQGTIGLLIENIVQLSLEQVERGFALQSA